MKMNKKRIILVVVAVVLVLVLGWRLWPNSFKTVISVNPDKVSSVTAFANVHGVVDGKSCSNSYKLTTTAREDATHQGLLDILNEASYRQDFRNLLPISIMDYSEEGLDSVAVVILAWGDGQTENCSMMFMGNTVLVSSGEKDGYHFFHTSKTDVSDKIVSYIQENGVEKE